MGTEPEQGPESSQTGAEQSKGLLSPAGLLRLSPTWDLFKAVTLITAFPNCLLLLPGPRNPTAVC